MLFELKNFVQKSYNSFTDLVDRSLKSSGVCSTQSQECWDKLHAGLPRFMEDMNLEIVTCDDIFNANMENPRGAAVRRMTVQRIGQEYGNIQTKCLRNQQPNAQTLACLLRTLPHYVPRSAAYFSSLQNAISQGSNLMGYVTTMAKSCYQSAYTARTELFNNGMSKLNQCVKGENSSVVALQRELDK
ncbi:AGAP009502-PA-like protein [Anopheles sinensis]|uniref:AGAP009502-PA-like protein n=1 Tax=Anopheles sinensis TaxID=74873 RepID=A0A084VCG3_ANOSI|nr:AGAP009502-PA-like protein [Anopheles sinensis]